jgi:pilus assembly protein Flp/PilA
MTQIASIARRFAREDEGATMIEYGLMVALIAVVCVAAVGLLGGAANTTFTTATGSL